MCLVEKVDIINDGNDDEDDMEEGDDDDGGNDNEDDEEEGDDDDDDGQVCLLGTGDIDRRRSCISDGGFRLIVNFATSKTKMYVFGHYTLFIDHHHHHHYDHGSVA